MNRIESPSWAGKLLLAHPSLRDPNFIRTVVYLVSHSPEEGAMGYVLNRPVSKTVGDLLPSEHGGPLAAMPVRWGGPVGSSQLSFALLHPVSEDESAADSPGVACKPGMSPEELLELAGTTGAMVHAFLGYAGWAPGQLENELKHRSWILHKAEQKYFEPDLDGMWRRIMRTLGPMFRIEAAAPDNPLAN